MGVILGRGGRPIYCGEGIIGRMDGDMTPSSRPVFVSLIAGQKLVGHHLVCNIFGGHVGKEDR